MLALPIDDVLPELLAVARRERAVVLEAPAGAGKTTRVPPALLELVGDKEIVVLEPRRLAARLAARRVAEERGERVGESIGYQVRFDSQVGNKTRVRYVTEELLLRQLLAQPQLEKVGAVVLDEFHERHIASDVVLALVAALQKTRDDLILVVMSATLEAAPVAAMLGCPVVRSQGRLYPVEIEYEAPGRERPLETRVASAVRRAHAADERGAMLVFLPGVGEIRRAADACAPASKTTGRELAILHGGLAAAEQDRALAPSAGAGKIVLSTNVAETSITVPQVTTVIDSGLARSPRHDPWSGLASLVVSKVSQASAAQRCGRAGRTAPGRCIRLYDEHDLSTRPHHDAPEITRSDLTGIALALAAAGFSVDSLHWLDQPPAPAITAAFALLERLGAVHGRDITELGRAMAPLPAHPRQSRIAIEGGRRGVLSDACVLAALVGARLRRPRARGRGPTLAAPSDLIEELVVLRSVARTRHRIDHNAARRHDVDIGAASEVLRVADQLEKRLRTDASTKAKASADDDNDDAQLIAIMSGFPDRIARRRRPGEPVFLLASGGAATLDTSSVVTGSDLIVAAVAGQHRRGTRTETVIRKASHVELDWVLEQHLDAITERDELEWDVDAERVTRVRELRLDQLVLEATVRPAQASPEASAVLAVAARKLGFQHFFDRRDAETLESWRARVAFAATCDDTISALTDDELDAALDDLCVGRTRLAELRGSELLDLLAARRSNQRAAIDRLAPTHVAIAGRRRVAVSYPDDREPWIESRLQDFFGSVDGPTVAGGAVPLVLHLLAPNGRAVQVTRDLAGFWSSHYPALRKQLQRRYPRHGWPDDPATSPPTRPGKRR